MRRRDSIEPGPRSYVVPNSAVQYIKMSREKIALYSGQYLSDAPMSICSCDWDCVVRLYFLIFRCKMYYKFNYFIT